MKKRVLTKWLKALRSGAYKQGRGALCQIDKKGNESFCCLGVLCDLYQKEQKRNKKRGLTIEESTYEYGDQRSLNTNTKFVRTYDFLDGTLPDRVIKWAGFTEFNGDGTFNRGELVTLNDGNVATKIHTFAKIADIIEEIHNEL